MWHECDDNLEFRECAGLLEGERCGGTAERWSYRWIRGREWLIQLRKLWPR